MTRWHIPTPLRFDWHMRDVADATIAVNELADGRVEHVIRHQPIAGVTPEMLVWFFENIDRELVWRGQRAVAYRFWHPVDHIHFRRHAKLGPGDRWHIVEAMGANLEFLVDTTFDVLKFDETGFIMALVKAGQLAHIIDERWEWTPAGRVGTGPHRA